MSNLLNYPKRSLRLSARTVLPLLVIILVSSGCTAEKALPRKGDRILFLGDSITELGVKPNGYVTLIKQHFAARNPEPGVEIIGTGISGNKVTDLQQRLESDVLSKKPTVVVVYIGINDVWHWALNGNGTTKDRYEHGLRDLIKRITDAEARVILCTPTVIGEKHDGMNPQDGLLNEYAEISRRTARDLRIDVCDLRTIFISHLKSNNPANEEKNVLTYDRVHLNDQGNKLVAESILEVLLRGSVVQ